MLQVKIAKPILRIPMLAIHLNRDIGTAGFNPNKQTHLAPMLATAVKAAANRSAAGGEAVAAPAEGGTGADERRNGDASGSSSAAEKARPTMSR